MGNILRKLCAEGLAHYEEHHYPPAPNTSVVYQAAPLGPHGVSTDTVGFAALARDLFQHEITGQVPEGLKQYVQSSKTTQANWYRSLLIAWKAAKPPPSNAQEASDLVLQTLKGKRRADVEGFLSFYGFPPSPEAAVAVPAPAVVVPGPAGLYPQVAIALGPWPKGVQYELFTLPVESKGAVDGDTLVVYVDASNDPREAAAVPLPVQEAVAKRRTARSQRDYKTADALQKEIVKAGYKVLDSKDCTTESLARKYRVRIRGIDAPENKMPYGQESKAMLKSLVDGESLHLLVYNLDRYGRIVADVYCSRGFVQEVLLKSGGCWHYTAYDNRQDFSKWEEEARAKRVGLWAVSNPEKPWEYRKENRRDIDVGDLMSRGIAPPTI